MIRNFLDIPVGTHRCRVISAKKTTSRSGHDMLLIRLEVYGCYDVLTHYITFLPDRPEIASRNLKEFFESFPELADNFDTSTWKGQEGAVEVIAGGSNDYDSVRIGRFIPRSKQGELPSFDTPEGSGVFVYDTPVIN